ncbi:MAG TPA: ATP-binding protein [Candidatus Acidoferrales bacterium]|nr:ATP-binding protein [Candidatus Acidoferrales bacterium]
MSTPLVIPIAFTEHPERAERRLLEEQLRQAQELESMRQLAGGVAHDFNNLLTIIRNGAELVLAGRGLHGEEDRENLRQVLFASDRAAALVKQLLAFGRKQVLQFRPLNLNETMENIARMIEKVLGANISLEVKPRLPICLVRADAGMMEQVLMNLAINARDAMLHGGQLTISTTHEIIERPVHPGAIPGTYVCLAVTDTGSGIPPEIMPRIFEPFFTTKAVGKGTGLGLATAEGIIRQHQGWITVHSIIGKGTTFRVHLPALPTGDENTIPPSRKTNAGAERKPREWTKTRPRFV